MKKFITAALITVISSTAFAGTMSSHSTIKTEGYQDKAQAYEAGYNLADTLSEKSSHQLGYELNVVDGSNVSLTDVEFSVEEFAKARGEIEYRAVLDVEYSYDRDDS